MSVTLYQTSFPSLNCIEKISQKNHAIVYPVPDTTPLCIVGGLSVCLSVSEPRVPGNTLPRTGGGPGLKERGSPGSCQGRAAD